MKRQFVLPAFLALSLGLIWAEARGQDVREGAYYNRYTGASETARSTYNPYTDTRTRTETEYNPYTHRDVSEKQVYNPMTGRGTEVRTSTNPYTGRTNYSAAAYRRR